MVTGSRSYHHCYDCFRNLESNILVAYSVFFPTLYIDGHRYAAFFHRWVGTAFSGRAFFPVAESYKG